MKLLGSILVVLAVLFTQVGNVAAAPQAQDTPPITGTITSIETGTDADGNPVVLVTLEDGQTVRLSVETAVTLGLVTVDETTGAPVVDETQVGQTVEIDPTAVLPEETDEDFHPIAEILGDFFEVDAELVNGYHEDGFGFGVIAQAMWLSSDLNDGTASAELTEEILQAKQDKDFEAFFEAHPEFVPEDGSIPSNWGQFKKTLKENKDKHNLGVIVSDHADQDTEDLEENGNGNGNGNDKEKKDKKDKKNKKEK